MTRWLDDPDGAAEALLDGALEALAPFKRALVAGRAGTLPPALAGATVWNRRAGGLADARVAPSPPVGPFDLALLRLPKVRAEFDMTLHLIAGVLTADGRIVVFGGNDEGIKTVQRRLGEIFADVEVVDRRGHGRVVVVRRGADIAHLKTGLADWRDQRTLVIAGLSRPWISYPGVFADGALDPGTALLLANLLPVANGARVLDYGCGTGVIAAHVAAANPAARLALLDNDSVALAAAAENVPGAQAILATALPNSERYDLIVTNPPLHVGIREDHSALERLLAMAPARLASNGCLILVVQRRVALDRTLAKAFKDVATLADDGRYRVWQAVK